MNIIYICSIDNNHSFMIKKTRRSVVQQFTDLTMLSWIKVDKYNTCSNIYSKEMRRSDNILQTEQNEQNMRRRNRQEE